MPDVSEQFLQSQSDLLRDIRDELRQTRSQAGMVGGAAPGRTFTAAQSAVDRTLSGEWNTLGWAGAYSNTYRSSFFGDISAMSGLSRAPETLTQAEFGALAGQNFMGRIGSAVGGLIAPGFAAHSNAMADEIYSHSGRFIRFGNSGAGALGAGFNHDVARTLGRQVSLDALSDLRLSQKDYGSITSLGMQAGQFDQVGGVDDFKKRVKELANATGDLTRALHMSVQEVGTAMGNMRMMGVTNIAQQRQSLMQAGGAALVAGMSTPEMLQFAGGVASQGLSMGLGAQSTFGLGATNMAIVRSMSAAGMLQNGIVAMGGGAANIAQNISSAQMAFASSNAGMMAFLGGGAGGGNSIDAMLRGLGKVGTSFEDLVSVGYDRVKHLSGMSGDDISGLFSGRIKTQLGMMGVTDNTSRMAQGMAFRMARGMGMEDAAAHVFVQSQFTEEGLRHSDQTRLLGKRAEAFRENAVAYDKYAMRNSFAGKVRGAVQGIGAFFGGMYDGVMDTFSSKQGDSLMGMRSGAFGSDLEAVMAGGKPQGELGLSQIAETLSMADIGGFAAASNKITVSDVHGGAGASNWVTAGLGMASGLGSGYMSIPASLMANQYATGTDVTFTDEATVKAIAGFQSAVHKGGSSPAAQALVKSGMMKGKRWEKILAKADWTKMSAAQVQEISGEYAAIAAETGMSVETLVQAAGLAGNNYALPDMVAFGDSKQSVSKSQLGAISDVLGDTAHLSNLATSSNSSVMQAYLNEALGGGISAETRGAASKALGSGSNFDRFQANVSKLISTEIGRGKVQEAAAGFGSVKHQVTLAGINSTFGAAQSLIGEIAAGSGFNDDSRKAILDQLSSVSGGKEFFLKSLNEGAIGDAAKSGKLGHLMQQVAGIASSEELNKMSAAQISSKYRVDVTEVEKIRNDNNGSMRSALQAAMLGEQAVGREQQIRAPMREAELLNTAAQTLRRINEELNGKTPSTNTTSEKP